MMILHKMKPVNKHFYIYEVFNTLYIISFLALKGFDITIVY